MASFQVNGRDYPIPEAFTLGELCDMERHFGVRFGGDMEVGISVTAAILYTSIRRVDPTVTVEDIRGMDQNVLQELGEEVALDSPPAESNSGSNETSGDGSDPLTVSPENDRSPTGAPV